ALAPSGDGLVPVDGVGSLTDLGARDPARSEDSTVRVMLLGEGDDTSLVLASQADRGPLLKQPNLVAPSVDQFDWVWTASGDTVSALNLEGHPEQLTASWLTGRTVLAVRASRDGTRIAVVSTGPDGTQIDVAGITRDDSGTPQTLSLSAQRVGAAVGAATAVVWTDDATLAALVIDQTSGTATVWQVPVGGPSLALPSLTGGVSLAGAGRFDRPLFVATDQGDLWQLNGLTWLPVMDVTGVRDPAYPG
ncbi:MAG: LpqB family beta-propeller domain-containing protein, partial [Micrococcales bacterium]|nr:LpqB family beta-propeller domain-containing protein [Micrococcales bacterium]